MIKDFVEKVTSRFKKLPEIHCPACRSKKFNMRPIPEYGVVAITQDGPDSLDGFIPVVLIKCDKCGHMMLFEAAAFGVRPEEKKIIEPGSDLRVVVGRK